jgi:hypothetical protein
MNLCTYQTTNRNGTIGERKIVPLSEAEVKSFLLLINVTLGWIFTTRGGGNGKDSSIEQVIL